MFEHLDDPEGLGPTEDLHAAVVTAGRRRKRARRLAGTGVAALAAVVVAAVATAAYVDRKVDRIDRVNVAGLADDPPADEPYTILVRGLDDATSTAPDDPIRSGRDGVFAERADTLVLVRVEPERNRITTMSVPRDLHVASAGAARINGLSLGDTVASIGTELGVEVHRVVETDLGGAMAIGDAVGGVRLAFDRPVRDERSGLSLDAGCQVLDGRTALALVRARQLAFLDGGTWVTDPTGDLGRIARLEPVTVAGVQALARLDLHSPTTLDRLLDALGDHAAIDARWSLDDLAELARHVSGAEVRQLALPVVPVEVDGAHLLETGPTATAIVDAFLSGVDAPASPADGPLDGSVPPVLPTPC